MICDFIYIVFICCCLWVITVTMRGTNNLEMFRFFNCNETTLLHVIS